MIITLTLSCFFSLSLSLYTHAHTQLLCISIFVNHYISDWIYVMIIWPTIPTRYLSLTHITNPSHLYHYWGLSYSAVPRALCWKHLNLIICVCVCTDICLLWIIPLFMLPFRPETQFFVEKMERERAEKTKGQQQDNRSFLGKYVCRSTIMFY